MRLYYLTCEKWARVILHDQRFKLSTIHETNDPFELFGAATAKGQPIARRAYKILLDHWTATLGMLCMTESWESPVMWAHYGMKHRGVCLGFDVTEAEIHQVRYHPKRLTGIFENVVSSGRMSEGQMTALLTAKFKDWEYEREWRMFASLNERNPENGLYYLNFYPHFTLREIILGARCSASPEDFSACVTNSKAEIKIIKARPAFRSFRMVPQHQVPSVIIPPSK